MCWIVAKTQLSSCMVLPSVKTKGVNPLHPLSDLVPQSHLETWTWKVSALGRNLLNWKVFFFGKRFPSWVLSDPLVQCLNQSAPETNKEEMKVSKVSHDHIGSSRFEGCSFWTQTIDVINYEGVVISNQRNVFLLQNIKVMFYSKAGKTWAVMYCRNEYYRPYR